MWFTWHVTELYSLQSNMYFFLQVLSHRFLNWHDRLYEKSYVISRKRTAWTGLCSQHDSLFANHWLPPLNLPFYFLKRVLLIWGIVFYCLNFLKIIVILNKCSFCSAYRVILRYLSWTSSIAHCWTPTRACSHSKLMHCVVVNCYIDKLQVYIWAPFFSVAPFP